MARRRSNADSAADASNRPAPSPTVPGGPPSFIDRWWGKLLLAVLATVMLTLTFAPFEQFYMAYVGIAPVLLIIRHSRTGLRAVLWTWVAGVLFFGANCYWLMPITGPGVAALVPVLALYWAAAALVLWPVLRQLRRADDRTAPAATSRLGRLVSPRAWVLVLVPAAWVGQEWLRSYWPWDAFPWHFVAHTQATAASLVVCQVADVFGEMGVSAWVALVNALVLLFLVNGWRVRGLLRPAAAVLAVTAAVAAYGLWRFGQYDAVATDGPVVLVVQPNYRQDNSGAEPRTPQDEINRFHMAATSAGLTKARGGADPVDVDLVAWPETMMPALNREYVSVAQDRVTRIDARVETLRAKLSGTAETLRFDPRATPVVTAKPAARPAALSPAEIAADEQEIRELLNLRGYLESVVAANNYLRATAKNGGVSFLVGGAYQDPQRRTTAVDANGKVGRANAAYYFPRGGDGWQAAETYLKIHLVPFGEFFPFYDSWPWLHGKLVALGPPNLQDYQLDRGTKAVVFDLKRDRGNRPAGAGEPAAPWRFVTPICFEDVDGDLCAWLVRGGTPRGSGNPKKADFIVNITNDGWFRGGQMAQHFQIARFRSIENRVPTARAVNTGISGYIDSMGRSSRDLMIPAGTEGTMHHRLKLDGRVTLYTRYGNVFGPACGILCGLVVLNRVRRKIFVEKE